MDLGLSRISRLVRDHHKLLPWKAVHIAGTNGKGTTSRFLEALLSRTGINVGLFNSPHLIHRHDCIRVGGSPLHPPTFLECEALVKQRNEDARINATAFELLTATAYEVFIRAKIDVAIIECGLGGRLDATNIFLPEEVLCSVITRIGLDHQDVLGDTIEQIATEKAGIIKENVPLVVDRTNYPEVQHVLRSRAEELSSPFKLSGPVASNDYLVSNSQLAKAAYFQITERLRESKSGIKHNDDLSKKHIAKTMQNAAKDFRGRFQTVTASAIIGSTKPIILDGAHNEQAAKALRYKVDKLHDPPISVTWVVAMSSTKNLEAFLGTLLKPIDRVVCCEFGMVDGMPWVIPMPRRFLKRVAKGITQDVHLALRPERALKLAAQITSEESSLVVCGSLYLIGHVLRLLEPGSPEAEAIDIPFRQSRGGGNKTFHIPNQEAETSDVAFTRSRDGGLKTFRFGSNVPQAFKVEETERRLREKLCLHCGAADHLLVHCPRRSTSPNQQDFKAFMDDMNAPKAPSHGPSKQMSQPER